MDSHGGLWAPVWEARAAFVPEEVVFGLADVEVATMCAGEAPGRPAERTWSCPAAACFHGGFWASVREARAAFVLGDASLDLADLEVEDGVEEVVGVELEEIVGVELEESTL